MEQTPAIQPTESLSARYINRAKPGDLRRKIRQLGLRTLINGKRFDPPAFIDGQHGNSPDQILHAARRQFFMRWRHLPEEAYRRLRYFFQAQMSPQGVRDAIYEKGLMGLSILAGHDRRFPKGVVFRSIDSLQVMTLSMRRDRPNDAGMLTDHFDVRLHNLELDRSTGVIHLGGSYPIDGNVYSRTDMSRDFSREPGRSTQAVPRMRREVIDTALALHEALESAGTSAEMGYQRVPVLPRIYYGFHDVAEAAPTLEAPTPSLRRTAMSFVLKWMRKGLSLDPGPLSTMNWQRSVAPRLMTVDPDSLEDWASLSQLLGPSDSAFLLEQMLVRNTTEFDLEDRKSKLQLLPASFFTKESTVKVAPFIKNIYARVSEHVGREVFRPDGSTDIDRRYGRLQVMQLVYDQGVVGNVQFDFTSTEVGKEREFA